MGYTGVLAQRYAEGLLGVVRDTGRFREVAEELRRFAELVSVDGRIRDLLENPVYSTADRLSLLEGLRNKIGLSDAPYGFLRLVIKKKRIDYLDEMVEAYEEAYRNELGIVRAEVRTAHEIDPEMETKIATVVQEITQKQPELSIRIDPDLIGGVTVRMGNTVLDASIKTKLEKLREDLLKAPQQTVG